MAAASLALTAVVWLSDRDSGGGGGGAEARIPGVVQSLSPSTVAVLGQRGGARSETGTGWVVDGQRDFVVTAAHVVAGGDTFRVQVGHDSYLASVVAMAPCDDIALLKAEQNPTLHQAPMGLQSEVVQGETVLALGYPDDASAESELVTTRGAVTVPHTSYRETSDELPPYPQAIQTDASLNPGNSGGPLVDLDGRVVGINGATRRRGVGGREIEGQGYAIGIDRVREVLPRLERGGSTGWTGLTFAFPTLKQLVDRRLPSGLIITGATDGTGVSLQRLDYGSEMLVAVDDRPVGTTMATYCRAVAGLGSGDYAKLTLAHRDPSGIQVRQLRLTLP